MMIYHLDVYMKVKTAKQNIVQCLTMMTSHIVNTLKMMKRQ